MIVFGLLGFAGAAYARGAEEVPLASVKQWDIVVTQDAIPSERYAAEEFQRFFEQATGARLPITSDVRPGVGHVFIGPGAARQAGDLSFDTDDFGPEDLRVLVRDTGIAIAGGRPRGTLYGVYTFLEDLLGIRFLTPDHTHVPQIPPDAKFRFLDKTYRPPLRFRWSYFGEIAEDHVFATRMRTNTVQDEEWLGGKSPLSLISHSFGHLMPWAQYGEAHPEYYNEIDGQRPKDIWNDQYDPGVELCTTNPDVVRIVTEAVLRDLEQDPERANVSVSQNDNGEYCQCKRCRAADDAAGSHMGSLLGLVNSVAEAVEREHPQVLVGTLAYAYSRKPPVGIRPRPNVQIQLCSIECCQTHPIPDPDCPRNPSFCEDLKGWGALSDNVYVWTYVTNFHNYPLPCPNLRALGPNVRFFVENGVKGLFMQGPAAGAEFGGLRNYIISNLIWDPARDDEALMDEFLTLHYGRAAEPIKRYIDLIHDAAESSGRHRNCFGSAAEHGLSADLGREGLRIFEEALRLAESEEICARVEKASIPCHSLIVEPLVSPAFQKVRSRKKNRDTTPFALDPDLARSLRPNLEAFVALCRKHQIPRIGEWATVEEVIEVLNEGYQALSMPPLD